MTIRTIPLGDSSVTNGRIYFPSTDHMFFPADSFGDRESEGHTGQSVIFKAGAEIYECDIRCSSSARLSPRSSFAKFLQAAGAVPSGSLRITRTADRQYSVEYLAPAAA